MPHYARTRTISSGRNFSDSRGEGEVAAEDVHAAALDCDHSPLWVSDPYDGQGSRADQADCGRVWKGASRRRVRSARRDYAGQGAGCQIEIAYQTHGVPNPRPRILASLFGTSIRI